MATRQEDNIVKCAERLVRKLNKCSCVKYNGQYDKTVLVEIDRMINHCSDSCADPDPIKEVQV